MGQTSRSRSQAEVTRQETSRFDSSRYWSQDPSFLQPQGVMIAGANRYRPQLRDPFLGKALRPEWNLVDTSAAGSPTSALVNALDGLWSLKLASTSESEIFGINFGDALNFDSSSCIFEASFTLTPVATSVQRCVIGLCSAHNDTFASMTTYAWASIDGAVASGNLIVESTDATTANTAKDTGVVPVAGQLIHVRIEVLAGKVYFFAGTGTPTRVVAATNFVVGGRLQPCALLRKDSGTTTPDLRIDQISVFGNRG